MIWYWVCQVKCLWSGLSSYETSDPETMSHSFRDLFKSLSFCVLIFNLNKWTALHLFYTSKSFQMSCHSAFYCIFHLNDSIPLFRHHLWKSKSPNKGIRVPPSRSCVFGERWTFSKFKHFSFFMHPYILKLMLTKKHSIRSAPATSRKKDPVKSCQSRKVHRQFSSVS